MKRPLDKETPGERPSSFLPTRWTIIHDAQTENTSRRKAALGQIFELYWKPVYCYLCRKGYSVGEAEDLTQGFFVDVALGKALVQQADRSKGRFRSFLLTALTHYTASIHRRDRTQRRSPGTQIVSLDGAGSFTIPEPATSLTPEDAFHYMWASTLLDQVLAEVQEECLRDGKSLHWQIFDARVVEPILSGSPSPDLAAICAPLGVEPQKASNMIATVKRRFEATLKRHIGPLVSEDAEIADEIADLHKILSSRRAR